MARKILLKLWVIYLWFQGPKETHGSGRAGRKNYGDDGKEGAELIRWKILFYYRSFTNASGQQNSIWKKASIHTQKQAESISPQLWKGPAHICTPAQSGFSSVVFELVLFLLYRQELDWSWYRHSLHADSEYACKSPPSICLCCIQISVGCFHGCGCTLTDMS